MVKKVVILLAVVALLIWAYYAGTYIIDESLALGEKPDGTPYFLYEYILYNKIGTLQIMLIGIAYEIIGLVGLAGFVLMCSKIKSDYEK